MPGRKVWYSCHANQHSSTDSHNTAAVYTDRTIKIRENKSERRKKKIATLQNWDFQRRETGNSPPPLPPEGCWQFKTFLQPSPIAWSYSLFPFFSFFLSFFLSLFSSSLKGKGQDNVDISCYSFYEKSFLLFFSHTSSPAFCTSGKRSQLGGRPFMEVSVPLAQKAGFYELQTVPFCQCWSSWSSCCSLVHASAFDGPFIPYSCIAFILTYTVSLAIRVVITTFRHPTGRIQMFPMNRKVGDLLNYKKHSKRTQTNIFWFL